MTKHRASTRAKWELLNSEFASQDLTVLEFCRCRGINYYTFKGWQAIFRKESSEQPAIVIGAESFRELLPNSSQNGYTMTLRGGRTLAVESSFIESRVRKLIEILESC